MEFGVYQRFDEAIDNHLISRQIHEVNSTNDYLSLDIVVSDINVFDLKMKN